MVVGTSPVRLPGSAALLPEVAPPQTTSSFPLLLRLVAPTASPQAFRPTFDAPASAEIVVNQVGAIATAQGGQTTDITASIAYAASIETAQGSQTSAITGTGEPPVIGPNPSAGGRRHRVFVKTDYRWEITAPHVEIDEKKPNLVVYEPPDVVISAVSKLPYALREAIEDAAQQSAVLSVPDAPRKTVKRARIANGKAAALLAEYVESIQRAEAAKAIEERNLAIAAQDAAVHQFFQDVLATIRDQHETEIVLMIVEMYRAIETEDDDDMQAVTMLLH